MRRLLVGVPSVDDLASLDGVPDVQAVVFPRSGERPAAADEIEVLVGPYAGSPTHSELLEAMPSLRVVQLFSAGVDQWLPRIPHGVLLCNGRGIHSGSTAELALAGLLSLRRRMPEFYDEQRARLWATRQTDDLDGARVLLIGSGDIAHRIGAAVEVFGALTTYVARTPRVGVYGTGDLPHLLPEQDVVVLALPYTRRTHRLVDTHFLACLRDGAILVNVARGQIVDTDALVAELSARRLWAFLDVTDPEPPPAGSPLWSTPNLLLTPHIGGGTSGWRPRAFRLLREQLRRYMVGEPLMNVVTNDY